MTIQQLEMTALALFWLSVGVLISTLLFLEYDNYQYKKRNRK
jgi:hypothetical protein